MRTARDQHQPAQDVCVTRDGVQGNGSIEDLRVSPDVMANPATQ